LRALFIGALGLALLGCSHSPAPQASVPSSCAASGAIDCDGAAQPAKPDPATAATKRAVAANITRPSAGAQAGAGKASFNVAATTADLANAQASAAGPDAKAASTPSHESAPRDAGRIAAATADERKDAPPSPSNTDALMAVVMARPDVKSVAELAGKTVAIDDRYAESNGKVRTAIAAAGATEVQLSEGQATAMSRLGNGEVPAAVVALVTPEAAKTFPPIAGYRIFHIPLSPRSVKSVR
jgi:hypothetical protein